MTPPPSANSSTKEARTMKLCRVVAYYVTSITKELKFLNSHCSIVCSYCSVVCLIAKSELKMIKLSSSFKSNEIHIVDSHFDEDPKNINLFQGGPNFGGSSAGKFSENGQQQGHLLLCKSGGGEFRKRISAPTSWYQNPCYASIFLHARPSFRKKK